MLTDQIERILCNVNRPNSLNKLILKVLIKLGVITTSKKNLNLLECRLLIPPFYGPLSPSLEKLFNHLDDIFLIQLNFPLPTLVPL